MKKAECDHYLEQVVEGVQPNAAVCEECGIQGPLRLCATCGYVGCCESRNSHDTMHWRQMGHAIILSLPLVEGRYFTYCYEHAAYLE
jgi:monovalent cation/hydrogen antiporter